MQPSLYLLFRNYVIRQSFCMKATLVIFFMGTLCLWSCTKKADVQCFCHGGNNQTSFYDFGIQKNPSTQVYAAKCDTFGAHNNLDSCNIVLLGK